MLKRSSLNHLYVLWFGEQVLNIWWAHDDFNIVTAGMDGAIYEWDVKTCKRSREHVIKGCMQLCVISSYKSKLFLSASSDSKLRELDAIEVFKVEFFKLNKTLIRALLFKQANSIQSVSNLMIDHKVVVWNGCWAHFFLRIHVNYRLNGHFACIVTLWQEHFIEWDALLLGCRRLRVM